MKVFFLVLVVFFVSVLKAQVQTFFSDQKQGKEFFLEQVRKEAKAIRIASYRLSDRALFKELLKARQRGVDVEVFVDASSVHRTSPLLSLVKEGIFVWVWKGEKEHLRESFCLFGENPVWIGMDLFSLKSSWTHRSASLMIEDVEVGKKFSEEWGRLKKGKFIAISSYFDEL